jgi:prevent-host-death family protein
MNNISLSQLVSISDLQRNYNDLVQRIKKFSEPIYLLRRNKPEAVLVSVDVYEKLVNEKQKYEEVLALMSIKDFESEKKKGKLKMGNKVSDLIDEN